VKKSVKMKIKVSACLAKTVSMLRLHGGLENVVEMYGKVLGYITGGTEGRPFLFRLHPPVPVTGGWFRVRIPVPGLSFFILFPRDFPIDKSIYHEVQFI